MVCMYHCLKNHYSSYHFIQNFYTIAGDDWIHAFNDAVPLQPSKVELEKITKNLTFDEVQSWIEDYNGIAGRFRFFEMRNRQSVFYQRVAKPLLSMRVLIVQRQLCFIGALRTFVIVCMQRRFWGRKSLTLFFRHLPSSVVCGMCS